MHDAGKVLAQSGVPPIAVKMSITSVLMLAALLMSGTSFGYTELMTVWLAPIESIWCNGGGIAVKIFGPAAVVPRPLTIVIMERKSVAKEQPSKVV